MACAVSPAYRSRTPGSSFLHRRHSARACFLFHRRARDRSAATACLLGERKASRGRRRDCAPRPDADGDLSPFSNKIQVEQGQQVDLRLFTASDTKISPPIMARRSGSHSMRRWLLLFRNSNVANGCAVISPCAPRSALLIRAYDTVEYLHSQEVGAFASAHLEVLEELQSAHIKTFLADMTGLTSFYLDGSRVSWSAAPH